MQSVRAPHYKYVIRIINPDQKSKHVTKIWHGVDEKFHHELKDKLIADFEDKLPPLSDLECGYMDKSAKRWIEDDQDVDAMYKEVNCGGEITIWCEGRSHEQQSSEAPSKNSRKRKAAESDDMPPTKRADKIDQLALELHEKHGEIYTMPHLRIWARMILNKQHKSLDVAPPFPLFKDHAPKHAPKRDNLTDALTSAVTAVVGMLKGPNESSDSTTTLTLSPGKRARVSGQYLEHLERLKSLYESEVLTTEEFSEQKKFALNNIRKLNE